MPNANAKEQWRHEAEDFGHPQLHCGLLGASFDFRTHEVTLYLPDRHSTDMRGAINYATARFPTARTITTVAGQRCETVYALRDGKWCSGRHVPPVEFVAKPLTGAVNPYWSGGKTL